MATKLGPYLGPITDPGPIPDKPAAGLPAYGQRIPDFDTWRLGYAGAVVLVVQAGTTTHARLFSDPTLATPIPNPVTLLTLTDENGATYGKWPSFVYTPDAYFFMIDEAQSSGISRLPLYDVGGLDLSRSILASTRGTRLQTVADFADREIHAEAFGSLAAASGSAAVTAVLERAIGAAAAQGGGRVVLPAGDIVFINLTLPVGVVLDGQGLSATRLVSTLGGTVITLAGDGSGLRNLTLDGVDLTVGSVGIVAIGLVSVDLRDVVIKRFGFGAVVRGMSYTVWRGVTFSNCVVGCLLRGDTDPTGAGQGGAIKAFQWIGGGVNLCSTAGLQLSFFDALVDGITLSGLAFTQNIGDSILVSGGRNIRFDDVQLVAADGQTALRVQDDTNLALAADNTVHHVTFNGGVLDGGALRFNGTCANIVFDKSDLRDVSFDLNVPENAILLIDCIEDADVTSTGDLTQLVRVTSADEFALVGNTTDGAALTAWAQILQPGQVAFFQAEAVAQRQDGVNFAIFWVAAGFARPGSELDYDSQTANFTTGSILTGATSGAVARIIADADSGASGTLTLGDISGDFIAGEALADADGGAAQAVGVLTSFDAALDAGGNTAVRADAVSVTTPTTTYDAVWDASGAAARLRVTGMATHTVQWTGRIRKLVT